MIFIYPATAIMLYLALTLTVLLGIWIYYYFRKKGKKILPLEKELWVCEYCHFPYVDTHGKKITCCPQCKSFNQNRN